MQKLLLVIALSVTTYGFAQQKITGIVFHDANANGKRDAGEAGVAGVVVSDQVSSVLSDSRGQYEIAALKGYGMVMISVPSGYSTPSFWKKVTNTDTQVDFALMKVAAPTEFSFIHASDTHISERSLGRMQKFRAAADAAKPNLILITGDLVRDALRVGEAEATKYYELFKSEVAKLKPPVWCTPGNHEIFGIERHLSLVSPEHPLYGRKMYHHFMGPDYYSFNYGGVHFIALNSLEYDDLFYYGRIDSVQLEWLKQDVAHLPKNTPIVTFQHAPFFAGGITMEPFEADGLGRTLEKGKGGTQLRHVVSNARDVFTILKGYNFPLALAGHLHAQQKFSLEGVQTRFEQTGAVIGPSDDGVFNMPSGITLYKVKDGKIDGGTFIRLDE